MRYIAYVVLSFFLSACASQPHLASKTIVIPAGLDRAYDDYHCAPAVRAGDTVIVSGVPAAKGDSYEAKVRWMFERVKMALAAAGATMDDVVEVMTFHSEAKSSLQFKSEINKFLEIHNEYFSSGYPAWTAVGNAVLLADGAPVEMRVVAIVGAGKNSRVERAIVEKQIISLNPR